MDTGGKAYEFKHRLHCTQWQNSQREQLNGSGEQTKGTWREQTKQVKNVHSGEKRKTLERTKNKNIRKYFYV